MHHIYHTEGIVLGSRNFGEAGKYFYIFTRDLGMITAEARGVRKMSSKLRFILQDFGCAKIDLVQGKNIFRVTSASKTGALERIKRRTETFEIFANISRLLRRLLAGVEPNALLFDDLLCGLSMLEKEDGARDLEDIEAVVVLRILSNLGYIGEREILGNLVKSPLEEDLIVQASKSRAFMLRHINQALKETHMV